MKTFPACSSGFEPGEKKRRGRPPKPKPVELAPKRPRERPKKVVDRVAWLQDLYRAWQQKRQITEAGHEAI